MHVSTGHRTGRYENGNRGVPKEAVGREILAEGQANAPKLSPVLHVSLAGADANRHKSARAPRQSRPRMTHVWSTRLALAGRKTAAKQPRNEKRQNKSEGKQGAWTDGRVGAGEWPPRGRRSRRRPPVRAQPRDRALSAHGTMLQMERRGRACHWKGVVWKRMMGCERMGRGEVEWEMR
eukprot:648055-Rhodomonas_salina.1